MQMHVRAIWKLEEVHLIWRVMCVALGPTVVLTPEPTLWDVWFPRYEHFRKNFFLVKKSKFWLRSPPEAPETPEMDCNMPHWRPLNDLSPRIDQKNGKKEGRGKRDGFRWVFSGGLVGGFLRWKKLHVGLSISSKAYIYKKSSWPKQKGSNSSQIIQWSSVGYITIHFRGLRGLKRAPKPKFWLFDQKIQMAVFARFRFLKSKNPISSLSPPKGQRHNVKYFTPRSLPKCMRKKRIFLFFYLSYCKKAFLSAILTQKRHI